MQEPFDQFEIALAMRELAVILFWFIIVLGLGALAWGML